MKKMVLALLITVMTASMAFADTVYLRDGRSIRGTVLGYISGRFAVRVELATQIPGRNNTTRQIQAGEVAFLRPRDIERIEIDGRSLDDARYLTRNVDVELAPNWIDSGVDLRRGQRVQVTSTGTIYAGRSRITPAGLRSTDPNAPLPGAAEGVLIGVIGTDANAPIIELGTSREFQADRDGRLYLTANRADYTDARGTFNVQVRREIDFSRRGSTARRDDNRTVDDDDDFFDLLGGDAASSAPVRRRAGGGGPMTTYPSSSAQERTIVVPGNSRGTDTGLDVRQGDQVTVSASGNITVGRRAGVVSADGGRVGAGSVLGTRPVPQAGVGALIGYIRMTNGQPSSYALIGSQNTFTVPVDGRLFLLVNDDDYSDNSGQFDVRISVNPR